MKIFLDREGRTVYLIVVLLLFIQIPLYFLIDQGNTGRLLCVFLLLLIIISLVTGPVTGLFSSLIFIFIVGTTLFYFSMTNSSFSIESVALPVPLFLGYGFSLLILVMIAGRIHDRMIEQSETNHRLQEEIRQFVAVDAETGFDNKHRMAIEVQEEMKRVDRYGGAFTLVLLQLDQFENFKRLYGEKETSHLLSVLAQSIKEAMRSTDKKFRYALDRFAILLSHTDEQHIDIVYDKLAEILKTHQLQNKKYVTLTFRSGHIVYEQGSTIPDEQSLFSHVESEMIAREL